MLLFLPAAAGQAGELRFAFGPAEPPPGYAPVSPQTAFDAKRGFGFLAVPAAGKPGVFGVSNHSMIEPTTPTTRSTASHSSLSW